MPKKTHKRRPFSHLTRDDRTQLELLVKRGYLHKEIAAVINKSESTVSRELRSHRRKNGVYDAATAEHKARIKRGRSKYHGRKIESDPALKAYIVNGLREYRSPDEIAGRMRMEGQPFAVSAPTIYAWLYAAWGQYHCRYLCSKRYRKKPQKKKGKREMIPDKKPLSERPNEGIHAEGDCFVSSKKSGTSRSGAVICIPETQLVMGSMIPDRRPATMAQAVKAMRSEAWFDDLTLDNGIENKNHPLMGVPAFFCDPHAPWQKPHVENTIGLLRRWCLPKGTDLSEVSSDYLRQMVSYVNGKYRRSLGYRSAHECSYEKKIIRAIPKTKVEYGNIMKKRR